MITEIVEAVEEDLETALAADSAEEDQKEEDSEEILEDSRENLLKCMMLLAVNAEKNARFHSDLQEASLFFAVIVLGKLEALTEVLAREAEIGLLNPEYLQNN